MITQTNKNARETPAMRLRKAREKMGLSRTALQDKTGISFKSIEHYEVGSSQPPIDRLKILSTALDVSLDYIVNGIAPSPVQPAQTSINLDQDEVTKIKTILARLDNLRKTGMNNHTRRIDILVKDLEALFKYLSYSEIMNLGKERKLAFQTENSQEIFQNLTDILDTSHDEEEMELSEYIQEEMMEELAARIIDTAFFDFDLYEKDEEALKLFAKHHDISPEGLGFYWGDLKEVVTRIRTSARKVAQTDNKLFDFLIHEEE